MIHMRMRQKNKVDVRQDLNRQRRSSQPLHSDSYEPEMHSRPYAENRVGKNGETIKPKQHGAVAKPGGLQTSTGPIVWIGPEFCRLNGTFHLIAVLTKQPRAGVIQVGAGAREAK